MSEGINVLIIAVTLTPIVTGRATNHEPDTRSSLVQPICDYHSGICCLPKVCGSGYEAIACVIPNTPAQCQPCPEGEYRDDISTWGYNDKCSKKKLCNYRHMFVEDEGGTTEDRRCTCTSGRVYDAETHTCRYGFSSKTHKTRRTTRSLVYPTVNSEGNYGSTNKDMQIICDKFSGKCCLQTICSPGYEVIACVTPNTTAQCQPCPKGEFRSDISVWGYSDRCSKKKPCNGRHMIVKREGGPAEDRQCSCKSGRVYDKKKHICRHSPHTNTHRPTETTKSLPGKSPADKKDTFPQRNGCITLGQNTWGILSLVIMTCVVLLGT